MFASLGVAVSVLFCIAMIGEFLFLSYASEKMGLFVPFVTIAVTLVAANYFGFGIFVFVKTHWMQVIIGYLIYLLIGVAWSTFKFGSFTLKVRNEIKAYLLERPIPLYQADEILLVQTDASNALAMDLWFNRKRSWISRMPGKDSLNVELLSDYVESVDKDMKPKFEVRVSKLKGRITSWIMLWPFSFTWTFIDSFVVKIADTLYRMVSQTYQRISDRIFRDLNE